MNTKTNPRFSSHDLTDKLTQHIHELAEATDAARMSREMQAYLEMCARFYQYSPHNVWLILLSCPHAIQVAGFRKWRSLGRYVCKGEKGIPILAPVMVKGDEYDHDGLRKLVGFRVVYVFDISQTEGEALPELPNWKSPEKNAWLQEQLIHFAEEKGIAVEHKVLPGETQGVSTGGRIILAQEAGTKTLIHEIAHELMHQGEGRPREKVIRELEAEAVAYVVARHFGMEDLASPNYVALHGADAEMIMGHLERIRHTAAEIIQQVECAQ